MIKYSYVHPRMFIGTWEYIEMKIFIIVNKIKANTKPELSIKFTINNYWC